MVEENGIVRTSMRAVARVGRALATVLSVGLVGVYLAVWVALAGTHVVRGDYLSAAITLAVFVLPVVAVAVWRRIRAHELGRDDVEVDVGTPSP